MATKQQGRIQRTGLGAKFWPRGPKLPPFSTFFTDLGHFIVKLLNFDVFHFMFIFYIYLVVFWGAKTYSQSVWGDMAPLPPGSALAKQCKLVSGYKLNVKSGARAKKQNLGSG